MIVLGEDPRKNAVPMDYFAPEVNLPPPPQYDREQVADLCSTCDEDCFDQVIDLLCMQYTCSKLLCECGDKKPSPIRFEQEVVACGKCPFGKWDLTQRQESASVNSRQSEVVSTQRKSQWQPPTSQ